MWGVRLAQKVLLSTLLAGALANSPAALGADTRVIASGVSVDGVDLSGLTVDAASQKLLGTLVPPLNRNIVVGAAGRVYRLAPGQTHLSVDGPTTARRAYYAGQSAGGAPVSVVLAVRHSHQAVAGFVARVAQRAYMAPRNATATITLTHIYLHHSQPGHLVDRAPLARAIDAAIDSPSADRVFHVKVRPIQSALTATRLAQQYTTVITVDRAHFRLRLFKRLRVVVTYPIAVGRAGLQTPTGTYHVLEREVNPPWHVPNSPWAGALAGQTIPPGPDDPIVARWLGLGGGVGIHGTNEPFSIGSAASHGCIRMLVPDVIALYPRVPLGTAVYIQ